VNCGISSIVEIGWVQDREWVTHRSREREVFARSWYTAWRC